ncbi:MAG TPA: M20/M25/M40 family metallo-hydrolase [Chloroflexota bacterium]|nr:M20/M25/M40 family metallo-hydrolase [Chloroflexota bacterium]
MDRPVPSSQLSEILAAIDPAEVSTLAQSLVQIPSVTGHEGLGISRFMANWLAKNGITSGLQQVGEERANVWGRIDGTRPGPRLLLNGHLDTKPGDTMTIDPFGGDISEGKLWGRGSCDMKGPVACEMIAMKAIAQSGVKLNGTLIFGSEVGEDGGGWKFQELIDGPGACDVGICGEPTDLELHIGCRGSYPLRIHAIGRATHTGTAYTGVNAVLKMCTIIPALYALPCFQRSDPIWDRNPINAMIIRGGAKVSSSVPDECVVQFDIRLNPDLPPQEVDRLVRAELARLQREDPELKLEVHIGREESRSMTVGQAASHIPLDDPLVGDVLAAIEAATGRRPRIAGFPGGCSTAIMLRRGIRSVIFGPGNLQQAHSVDEWIALDQLDQAAKAYASIAYQLPLFSHPRSESRRHHPTLPCAPDCTAPCLASR